LDSKGWQLVNGDDGGGEGELTKLFGTNAGQLLEAAASPYIITSALHRLEGKWFYIFLPFLLHLLIKAANCLAASLDLHALVARAGRPICLGKCTQLLPSWDSSAWGHATIALRRMRLISKFWRLMS
jgi:hypothetical protein